MTPEDVEAKNEELLRAYRLTFNSPAGQLVLLDLMSFGKFRVPIEDRADEGKRQVVLRIMNFTELSMEQLQAAYRGHTSPRPAQGAHGHDDQTDPLK
jgi:hypothetical protein